MIIIVVIIILLIACWKPQQGGKEVFYIVAGGKNNEFVRKIFVLKQFINGGFNHINVDEYKKMILAKLKGRAESYISSMKSLGKTVSEEEIKNYMNITVNSKMFKNAVINMFFNNIGDLDVISLAKNILINAFGKKNCAKLKEYYNSLLIKYPVVSISKKKAGSIDSCKIFHFKNRIGYSATETEKINATYFTDFITQIAYGNQLTLISDARMKKLLKEGLIIECFGSSFNTRAPYFGSLSVVEEPFGRIGDAFEILKKISAGEPLYWRNKLINNGKDKLFISVDVPSSAVVVYEALNLVIEILGKRKIKILFEVPQCKMSSKFDPLDKYKISETVLDEAWGPNGEYVSLKGLEWVSFILENLN